MCFASKNMPTIGNISDLILILLSRYINTPVGWIWRGSLSMRQNLAGQETSGDHFSCEQQDNMAQIAEPIVL
jgi:hypothetical protein